MKTTSKKPGNGKSVVATDSSLYDFFIYQLHDIYWAEKHLAKTFPKIQKAANADELQQIFRDHLTETENQISRLEEIFGLLGVKAQAKKCEAMEGLIRE